MNASQSHIVLTTQRLILREMEVDDLDFIASMLAHPEVMKYYPKCYSRDESAGWIRRQQNRYTNDGYGLWLAINHENQNPVGQAGLVRHIIEGEACDEIGYLIHRPFWRNYYATEAATAVREYAFNELHRSTVCSLIRPENKPSQSVAKKLGMTPLKEVMFAGYVHLHYAVNLHS